MSSAISRCDKEGCMHYWVCKNKEVFQKAVEKMSSIKIDMEIPVFSTAIQEVSLFCKYQKQPKYGNSYPKYRSLKNGYECTDCKHLPICKNQEKFCNIADSVKNEEIPIVLHCPHYKKIEKKCMKELIELIPIYILSAILCILWRFRYTQRK